MYKKDLDSNVESLLMKLEKFGIDTDKFGQGEAKTLEQLQKEIDEEETILEIDEDGKLLRIIEGVVANVFFRSADGELFKLKEDKQVFTDGRVRIRNYKVGAVSEKKKANETPEETLVRGIGEELGIYNDIEFNKNNIEEEIKISPSYPGLRSKYINHCFDIYLSEEQFQSEGYVEIDSELITYFVWEKIN